MEEWASGGAMLGVQAASEKADDSVRVFDADEMWWHAAMEAESHLGAQMPDTMYARENGPPETHWYQALSGS